MNGQNLGVRRVFSILICIFVLGKMYDYEHTTANSGDF